MPYYDKKRALGQFYTKNNPFKLPSFKEWAQQVNLKSKIILEPFAGSNNIIAMLQDVGYAEKFVSYDIEPTNEKVSQRDTIKQFPTEFDVVITNPPWLARNSATRRWIDYPDTIHDNMYKHCLELCLKNCSYVAALVPATFLQSELFTDRLDAYILLHNRDMFFDSETPGALVLFKKKTDAVKIFYDDEFIGTLDEIKKHVPEEKEFGDIHFNDTNGNLGFVAYDNIGGRGIKFMRGDTVHERDVKGTTRMITRIGTPIKDENLDAVIRSLNKDIETFRDNTHDSLLNSFRGMRRDGMFRRRMTYTMARKFIVKYL